MQDHPNKLILGWMGHLSAPEWDDKKAYSSCYHCNQKFTYAHQHNCRLCGHMFCSMCTAKYLVNSQFKRKDKDGPDRVCFGCRDQCLERRSKFIKNEPPLKPQMVSSYDKSGVMRIYPPIWAKPGSYNTCKLCHEPLADGKTHNCRTCGEMFDNDCTTKMDVPPLFLKKMKKNPARVCHECRYHIAAGAVLDEGPVSPFAVTNPRLHVDDIDNTVSATKLKLISVRWSESNDKPIATLNVVGQTTLEEIHERLLKTAPKLKNMDFTFICRGRPIFREHWGVFNADFLYPEVIITPGSLEIVEEDAADDIPQKYSATASPSNEQSKTSRDQGFPLGQSRKSDIKKTPSPSFQDQKRTASSIVEKKTPSVRQTHQRMIVQRSADAPSTSVLERQPPDDTRFERTAPARGTQISLDDGNPVARQPIQMNKTLNRSATPDKEVATTQKYTDTDGIIFVRCQYEFKSDKPDCLPCAIDEILAILKRPASSGWWLAQNQSSQKGWVPAKFMAIIENQIQPNKLSD